MVHVKLLYDLQLPSYRRFEIGPTSVVLLSCGKREILTSNIRDLVAGTIVSFDPFQPWRLEEGLDHSGLHLFARMIIEYRFPQSMESFSYIDRPRRWGMRRILLHTRQTGSSCPGGCCDRRWNPGWWDCFLIGDLGFGVPGTLRPVVRGRSKRWIRVASVINLHRCDCGV